MRHQDVVDAAQLGVDLEAEVGEGLRRRLHYVLHLHALGGHAEESVTHPLHLGCGMWETQSDEINITKHADPLPIQHL